MKREEKTGVCDFEAADQGAGVLTTLSTQGPSQTARECDSMGLTSEIPQDFEDVMISERKDAFLTTKDGMPRRPSCRSVPGFW